MAQCGLRVTPAGLGPVAPRRRTTVRRLSSSDSEAQLPPPSWMAQPCAAERAGNADLLLETGLARAAPWAVGLAVGLGGAWPAVAEELAGGAAEAVAAAAEATNSPGAEEPVTLLQNIFGVAFTAFAGAFFVRVLRKRAVLVQTEKFRSGIPKKAPQESSQQTPAAYALAACSGFVITALLYAFATQVEGYFEHQVLSETYAVRNMQVTIKTIVVGLVYLAAFIYGANSVGVAGYTIQILLGLDDKSKASDASKPGGDAGESAAPADGAVTGSEAEAAQPAVPPKGFGAPPPDKEKSRRWE